MMQFHPVDYYPIMGNITKNEEKRLIKVSKENALKLNKEYGIIFGENGLSRTHGHHKHYFLAETERNLRTLLEFDSHDEAKRLLAAIEKKKEKYRK